MNKLTENEEAVLVEFPNEYGMCFGYAALTGTKGLDRKGLEPIIKHLKELGYIEFMRGLMTEDGEVAGSGWCRTGLGNEYIEEYEL